MEEEEEGIGEYFDRCIDQDTFPNCIECSEHWLVMKEQKNFFHLDECGSRPFSGKSEPQLITLDEWYTRLEARMARYKQYIKNMKSVKCSCGENATGTKWTKFHNRDLLIDVEPSCIDCGYTEDGNGREVGFIDGDPKMVLSEVQRLVTDN